MRRADLPLLECPRSRSPLLLEHDGGSDWIEQGTLCSATGALRYPVRLGVPQLLPEALPEPAARQRDHYTRVAAGYLSARAELPFTRAYCGYLDRLVTDRIGPADGLSVLEACCGDGAFLAARCFERAAHRVGLDVTPAMLDAARGPRSVTLVCGDATRMPVRTGAFDLVLFHGGVHHVPDRQALFSESFRALRPGGRLVCLEPVDDFAPHRWVRRAIYSLSPLLDQQSEHPLLLGETRRQLQQAGFSGFSSVPCGYLGAGLLANTDVMGFMRHLLRVPGHALLTRALIACDELWRLVPLARRMALMAIVTAGRP